MRIWRTVRVFVSSTFRDMHAERDYLSKVVFPELRERCSKRQLYLIDLDLRWGVTEEEVERGKILDIILDEIDRSRPFFVALLGERYGSIPHDVPETTRKTYPWLRDADSCSLTELEIIHGVLRKPEAAQGSFFYFRDPKIITQIPEKKWLDFVTENPGASRKLSDLKDRIQASGRPVMKYTCSWDDDVKHLVRLDAFGQRVLEDLWTAICKEYPEQELDADSVAVERQMHESFVQERSNLFAGRLKETTALTQYVEGADPRPIVITGGSGSGKSAFLANWYRQYATHHPSDFVLAYFIGASPDSTNHHKLIRNMCEELKQEFSFADEIPQDDEKLSHVLARMLTAASIRGRIKPSFLDRLQRRSLKLMNKGRVVIIIDALNQLLLSEGDRGLSWLLDSMPREVRLVMSSLESECLDILRRRGVEEIALSPLRKDEQRQIVQTMLSFWGRKLDKRQIAALLAHKEARNPLYLRVSLQELRLFGTFKQLTRRIELLAEDIPGLFDQVLERLEEDHGRELVEGAFSMLACSRNGLSEAELLDLLKKNTYEQLPRAPWACLFRSPNMREYLVQSCELIGFFHQQLSDAATNRYVTGVNMHAKMAAYFEHAPLDRKLDEYPFQLECAKQWGALAATLSDLDFFQYAGDHGRLYEWMGYWRSAKDGFEPGLCYLAAIKARERMEGVNPGVAILSHNVGYFLAEMRLYSPALPFFEHALEIEERTLGANNPEVAATLLSTATVHSKEGRYAEALRLYERALEIQEHALGKTHAEVAITLYSIASVYDHQGRYTQSLRLYERALEIQEHALGKTHAEVAITLVGMGFAYGEQGKYAEALRLYERALKIREHALGMNHPDVAITLIDIAAIYREQGKYSEALGLYERALEIREHVLGMDHPGIANIVGSTAVLCHELGWNAEALRLFKRALKIQEHALGMNHPDVAITLNNLGTLYRHQGRYAKALRLYERALRIQERALDANHPDVADTLGNMALLHDEQDDYTESLRLYERALEIQERVLDANHSDIAITLNNAASVLCKQGRYAEALLLYQRAVRILEVALGPNATYTKSCKDSLKTCRRAMHEKNS